MRRGSASGERSGDMKRAGRWLFNFAAAVSLGLCASTIMDRAVQQRHFHWFGVLTWRTNGSERVTRGLSIACRRGVVIFSAGVSAEEAVKPPPSSHFDYGMVPEEQNWTPRGGNPPDGSALVARARFELSVQKIVRDQGVVGPLYNGLWAVSYLM